MDKKIRFIRIFGYVFLSLFIGCLYTFYVVYSVEGRPFYRNYFGLSVSTWYLLTAIGVLRQTKWGYYLFKFSLYVFLLGFPIGTIISYKSLSYMKRNKIRELFGLGNAA